jgi:hypothetical protein
LFPLKVSKQRFESDILPTPSVKNVIGFTFLRKTYVLGQVQSLH